MNTILTIAVLASILFAWICVFYILPSSLMSMFRYRLWEQRDELATEIRNGAFADPHPAECLLARIESFIRQAPHFSALNIGLMRVSAKPVDKASFVDDLHFDDLTTAEREILEKRLLEFYKTVTQHVLLETPSGWLTTMVALPIGVTVLISRRLRHDPSGTLADGARRRVSQGSLELAQKEPFAPTLGHGQHLPV